MTQRIVWPLTVLLGVGILAVAIANVPAQQAPVLAPAPVQMPLPRPALQPGRFAVAYATEKQIVILDTATGKLYQATPLDFRKYSSLPKVEGPVKPIFLPARPDKAKVIRPKDKVKKEKNEEK